MEAIKYYVKGAFVGIAETPEVLEQQEELIADLTAKVADLVADGRTEEEALGTAIASMGDLSGLVREFAAEEPAQPAALVVPVTTVEAYSSRLRLHSVFMSAGGAVALLFVLSVLALNVHVLDGQAALWDVALTLVGVAWVAYALRVYHQRPDEVATVELSVGKRLRTALLQWFVVCVLAFALNVGAGAGFFSWTVWIGSAAWPASLLVERELLRSGRFLHPKVQVVADGALGEAASAGVTVGGCA